MNDVIDMWYPSRLDPEHCPLDFFIAKYVAGLDRDRINPANSKMRAGSEAHRAWQMYLEGKPLKEAIETCKHELSRFNAPNAKDHEQHKLCLKHFDTVVNNFVLASAECNIKVDEIEQLCKTDAEGIDLNVGGYVDVVEFDYINEAKSKWPTPFLKADGTYSERTQSLPKGPTASNVRQAAIYSRASNKPVRIIYANHKGYMVFDQTNCESLQPEALNAAFETMRLSARARQNLLKISNDPEIISRYVIPNFSHYVWNNVDSEIIARVKEIWGYRNG
tara:strand:+ start:523 stop:1353 length:831 start_codon:yes stop_codon:yes gene_type:complete